jgi:hypothetical protein
MKKLFSFLTFLIVGFTAFSQTKGYLQYDSVYFQRQGGNSELILLNKTRDSVGFLVNKGGGRTEFRRILKTLNDSTFIVGGDTLKTKAVSNRGEYIQNQYSTKQTASAWIDSLRLSNLNIRQIGSYTTPFLVGRSFDSTNKIELRAFKTRSDEGASMYFGDSSGANIQAISGSYNGVDNTTFGYRNLVRATTALSNTAFGTQVLMYNVNGNFNSGFGSRALENITTGDDNLALGQAAMFSKTSGSSNIAVGNNALSGNLIGSYNTAIGKGAGGSNSGSSNIFIGYTAGSNSGAKSNSLYIDNTNTEKPLIGGDFINRRLFVNNTLSINDTSVLNLDVHKFYVNGSSKFAGNIVQTTGRTILSGAVDDGATPLQVNGNIYNTGTIRVTGNTVASPAKMVMDFGWSGGATFTQDTTFGELVFSPAWYNSTYKYAGAAIRGYFSANAAGIDDRNGLKFYTTANDGWSGVHFTDKEAMKLTPWGTLMINSLGFTFDGTTLQVKNRYPSFSTQTWYNSTGTLKASMSDAGKLTIQDLNLAQTYTPTSSADATGVTGDVKRDDNYLYIKTSTGWKRTALTTF